MDCSGEKPASYFDVVVVGACFSDLLTYVPKYPKPGETAHGRKFMFDFGGKGANMCIMATKLGAKTAMVSIVGHDVFGRETIGNFKKFGVNTDCIIVHEGAATGITNCIVDDEGEPSFISIAGVTKLLTAEHIDQAKCIIEKGRVLITNKGIPLPTALAALKLGKSSGLLTIFNPAPKLSELDDEFYTNTDIFVLNMDEAASLTNTSVRTQQDVQAACSWFHKRGVHRVVITMRENGAVGSIRDLQSSTQTGITDVQSSKGLCGFRNLRRVRTPLL